MANRCDICLAASHVTKDCALALEGYTDLPSRLRAVESAVVVFLRRLGGTAQLIVVCKVTFVGP